MTYKTRQEVLRAAADWMDVCEEAGVVPKYKLNEFIYTIIRSTAFDSSPQCYEFPIALLEGKEVWVGSELYDEFGRLVRAEEFNGLALKADGRWYNLKQYSWNQPKPATVMVEMHTSDAEKIVRFAEVMHITIGGSEIRVIADACKKALEKL